MAQPPTATVFGQPKPVGVAMPGASPAGTPLASRPSADVVRDGPQGPPGEQGPKGDAGDAGPVATVVCAEAIPAIGLPVYVDRATRQLRRARADTYVASFVAGLSTASAQPGFTAPISCGQVIVADWTPITGATDLVPGLVYFLAPTGGLTTTPPLGQPGVSIVTVGRAADARTLYVAPSNPILQ